LFCNRVLNEDDQPALANRCRQAVDAANGSFPIQPRRLTVEATSLHVDDDQGIHGARSVPVPPAPLLPPPQASKKHNPTIATTKPMRLNTRSR
jgi:hypothetical protein